MLPEMPLKKILARLLALGVAAAIGIVPETAEALFTTTAAMRFGAADESGFTLDMNAVIFDGTTYLAVLEQWAEDEFIPAPFKPPYDGFLTWPGGTNSPSDGAGESGGDLGLYEDIRVLRVIDVTTDQWVELFSMEISAADDLEFVELSGGQLLVAALMQDRIKYYNMSGEEFGETLFLSTIGGDPGSEFHVRSFDVASLASHYP